MRETSNSSDLIFEKPSSRIILPSPLAVSNPIVSCAPSTATPAFYCSSIRSKLRCGNSTRASIGGDAIAGLKSEACTEI